MTREFLKSAALIAIPATLQAMLQSAFSMADQLMIGQLQETVIAAVGFCAKFVSLQMVICAAAASAASIFLSQYEGQNNRAGMKQVLNISLGLAIAVSLLFTFAAIFNTEGLLGMYTKDPGVIAVGMQYLPVFAFSFPFSAAAGIYAAALRCCGYASLPLKASAFSLLVNTALNGILIFGLFGFPALGAAGAAWASLASQVLMGFLIWHMARKHLDWMQESANAVKLDSRVFWKVLIPLLASQACWSLAENVYAMVYGHMGTGASAAITAAGPIQSLTMGMLIGLSQAAGIITGQQLGKGDIPKAIKDAHSFMMLSFVGSLIAAVLLYAASGWYVSLFNLAGPTKETAVMLIRCFALIMVVKVQNMVLGGGIIRSGGRTSLILAIDFTGTWLVGVPLAIVSAFVWNLPVVQVYLLLSLEECVRLLLCWILFKSKRWIQIFHSQSKSTKSAMCNAI